jgi:hypothetical protein
MNLVLAWCGKEWRSQRALLGAYLLLAFACLLCGLWLAPQRFWRDDGVGASILAMFVGAAALGVPLFAAPALVRGEYAGRDDQFVRRLPGALLPSFLGKLLFLLLCAAALPVLGLAAGELSLLVLGRGFEDLFTVRMVDGAAAASWSWPWLGETLLGALLVTTVVWALATCMPGGRMAFGAAALLLLALGLGVSSVLRACPQLGQSLAWQPWLGYGTALGAAAAAASWVRGRRGGGAARSARLGCAVLGAGLLPPAGWLGLRAWEYHHPDLDRLAYLRVAGVSPDLRFLIGRGMEDENWDSVPLRIDLGTGAAEQIGGIHDWAGSEVLRPFVAQSVARQRWWRMAGAAGATTSLFDLVTGQRLEVAFDRAGLEAVLPADLRARVEEETRAAAPFRTPDGLRAWVSAGELRVEQRDGATWREPWPQEHSRSLLVPAGHGIAAAGGTQVLYDLARRKFVTPPGLRNPFGWAVRGIWIVSAQNLQARWRRFDPDRGDVAACSELEGCAVLGLFDDDRLLCSRPGSRSLARNGTRDTELLLYRPADRDVQPLSLPAAMHGGSWWIGTLGGRADRLQRDLRGRTWLLCCRSVGQHEQHGFVTIDPATLAVAQRLVASCVADARRARFPQILAFVDERTLLVLEEAQVLRIDVESGERTVMFPRAPAGTPPAK